MSKPTLKYDLQITQVSRYDWSVQIVDTSGDKPSATTILAKSLPELMAQALIAVVLHEKNAMKAASETNGGAPIVLTPNPRIITP